MNVDTGSQKYSGRRVTKVVEQGVAALRAKKVHPPRQFPNLRTIYVARGRPLSWSIFSPLGMK